MASARPVPPRSRRARVFGVVGLLICVVASLAYLVGRPMATLAAAQARTESDFCYQDFTIAQVSDRSHTNNGEVVYSHPVLEPENASFDLVLGMDKLWINGNGGLEAFADEFQGRQVRVKVAASDLRAMRDDAWFSQVRDYLFDEGRDLEVYELQVNGKRVYRQDIHQTAAEFRNHPETAALRLGCAALALMLLVGLGLRLVRTVAVAQPNRPEM